MKKRILVTMMPLFLIGSFILGCGHRPAVVETPDVDAETETQEIVEPQKLKANIYYLTTDGSQILNDAVEYETFDENFILDELKAAKILNDDIKVNSVTLATENDVKTITVDFSKELVDYLNTFSNANEFGVTTAIANTYLDYFNADRFVFRVNGKELKTNNKKYSAYLSKFEGTENPEYGKFETVDINDTTNEYQKSSELFESLDANENLVFSPLLLKSELFSVYNGADKSNKDEIEDYIEDIDNTEKSVISFAKNEDITNALIYHQNLSQDIVFKQDYLNSVSPYNLTLKNFNFTDKKVTDDINAYAKDFEYGSDLNIFDAIDPNSGLFEVGFYNFDKKFVTGFDSSEVNKFSNEDNSESYVTFYNEVSEMDYFETADVKGFVKEYEESGYKFIAILPKKVNVDYSKFDIANILDNYNLETKVVKISVPEFSSESVTSYVDAMRSNNINKIFTYGNANFTNMFEDNKQIFVSDIKQYVKFSLNGFVEEKEADEEITEEKTVLLNQPFVYIVYNETLDEVVVMGQVKYLEPTAEAPAAEYVNE